MEDGGIGENGSESGEQAEGFDGEVFEFVGDDLAGFGEAAEGGGVVKRGGEGEISHGSGGAGRIGIENGDAVTQTAGGEGEHAAELTSADDSDGLAWRNHER